MATLRSGVYGGYYGSLYNESSSLSQTQMNLNAVYIATYLISKGWTIFAVAGILGNMQAESSLNPGRWQSEDVGNSSGGYGLVQWTPASKYLEWCNANGYSDPSEMDNNLKRIIYELENNLQWIPTSEYPESFLEFSKSNNSPTYLASAFLKNYERAGVEVESTRRQNALDWLNYLINTNFPIIPDTPTPTPTPTTKKKKKFNFVLFNRRRRVF